MERRLFPRVYKSLQFEYQAQFEGSEDSFSNRAIMKDISKGGLYFVSETAPILQPGDIADFIFKFQPDHAKPLIPDMIKAKGKVKRLEQPTKESSDFGIALEFLSGPVLVYADSLPMNRTVISKEELQEWLTNEIRKFDGYEEYRFGGIIPLRQPNKFGCNWSAYLILRMTEVPPEIWPAYEIVMAKGRSKFNIP